MPKVSVCLPVYNGERYLAEAIQSVLAQKHENFELLISDDCSTDSSFEIANSFAQRDQRLIVWRNETNKGLFANYNACIQRASGEFIKPFAQDDVLDPELLEKQVAVLSSLPNVALVASGKKWISDDGRELKSFCQFPESRTISGRELIRYNLLQLTNWVGEPSTVMFRTTNAGTGFDTSFYHYGDIEYWFRIVENSDFYYLSEVLCKFRRHKESTTTKNLSGLYFALDILALGRKYKRYYVEVGETDEHFARRALEVIALNVDHLVRNEGLTLEQVLSVGDQGGNGEAFRELSFHALRYITQLIAEHDALKCRTDAEREHLQTTIEHMRQSTSWKITAPLRQFGKSGVC